MTLSATQIAEMLRQHPPTAEQVDIIEAPLEPMLVIAGAGSGKTETMSARVVWLIANGLVAPEQVLGLTFTRKAAGELADRVMMRLSQLAKVRSQPSGLQLVDRPTVATYNAYAASLVTDHALRLGVEPDSRLLGEASGWQLAADVVESWAGDLDTDAAFATVVGAVLSLAGAMSEHLVDVENARTAIEDMVKAVEALPYGPRAKKLPADVIKVANSLNERLRLLDVVAEYQERKRLTDALDFGDQIAIAARLAKEVPAVARAERARFKVVLLDEYQDTSFAQDELLSALFGDGHPVTAVGDPNQSIYGWRGASASGLVRFPHRFPVHRAQLPGARIPAAVKYLNTSWRNDLAVLDVANVVSEPLRRHSREVLVPTLDVRPGAGRGAVHTAFATTIEEEAAAVADFIAARWRPGAPGGSGRVTAAVLCRNRAQFLPVEVALRARGLPVEVVGLGGLLSTPEVVDVVALLEAAHDPSRGDALMRVLTGPRVNLGAADIHALGSWAADLARSSRGSTQPPMPDGGRDGSPDGSSSPDGSEWSEPAAPVAGDTVDNRSIVDALDDLPALGEPATDGRALTRAAHARLAALARVLRELRGQTYLSLPEIVVVAERALGLDIEVVTAAALTAARGAGDAGCVGPDRSEQGAGAGLGPAGQASRGRAHLDAFRQVAATFAQSTQTPTLGAFLAWLRTATAQERGLDLPVTEPDPTAVQIITVHAAKGLEWDVVAVPGLVDGLFPNPAVGADGPKDTGWLTRLDTLPFPLRGDRDDLPVFNIFGAADGKDLEERRKAFVFANGDHQVAEERRLAYVAFTRARRDLLLAGSWWRDGAKPKVPSPFLTELVDAGLITDQEWDEAPDVADENPRLMVTDEAMWPPPQESWDRQVLQAAAQYVMAVGRGAEASAPGLPGGGATLALPATGALVDSSGLDLGDLARALIAERQRHAAQARIELPAHVSASGLVRLAQDRDGFAMNLRRPIPSQPTADSARGTRFHLWAQRFFTSSSLLDPWDLPGADDEQILTDADLSDLQAAFEASDWARRVPIAVEVDVETPVAGTMLRCRIDAIFAELPGHAGGHDDAVVVVDWKTGRAPRNAKTRQDREVQLAAYRLAWSRWSGTPLGKVHAAFHYVGSNETVRPQQLLDEAQIEALLLGQSGQSGQSA